MPDKQKSLEQACRCARIADDYRGGNTVVLDLTAITPIADFFVITTGTSPRQMQAIAEEAARVLKSEGSQRLGIEGQGSNHWILQDYGDVVLHIFSPDARTVYDLERLWADAPRIDWQTPMGQSQVQSDQAAQSDQTGQSDQSGRTGDDA